MITGHPFAVENQDLFIFRKSFGSHIVDALKPNPLENIKTVDMQMRCPE